MLSSLAAMFANEVFLDQLIANQHRAMRYYLLFAVGLAVLGIAVMIVAYMSSGWLIPEAFKSLFGIGGAFVSSLSALQVKEILNRKEKVEIYKAIKLRMRALEQARDSADEAAFEQLENLVWEAVKKTALG